MDAITWLGLLAGVFSTGSLVPQVVKTVRTCDTSSLSLLMCIIFWLGIVLWIIYGMVIKNVPVVACNAANLVLCSILLVYKLRYK